LYELATNATKYGALSAPSGQIKVTWRVEQATPTEHFAAPLTENRRGSLVFEWIEQGGPEVEPPNRRGFGSELIERQLRYELNGKAAMTFEKSGLHVTLTVPITDAIQVPHWVIVASELKPVDIDLAKKKLAGKRVLLVEDSALLCFALEQTLLEAGCEIIGPCCRLADAIDQASSHEFDCALLDINLSGEMVSPLANQLRERGVPFVLTSAYGPDELPRVLVGDPQIRKPFTDTEMLERLASILVAR
jgi:CheY-like chemotaxis protein